MPVLWSPDMKHQYEASTQDLEKRLRFLDEYKRIGNEADEITDSSTDAKDEEEIENRSPSSQFFLTK
jgi:hypothetical protein